MKFRCAFLPNLCIALNLALLVVVILDVFNPFLGLLKGSAFLVLAGLCALSSIAAALQLYVLWRRAHRVQGKH